jgi:hypothetical protein
MLLIPRRADYSFTRIAYLLSLAQAFSSLIESIMPQRARQALAKENPGNFRQSVDKDAEAWYLDIVH